VDTEPKESQDGARDDAEVLQVGPEAGADRHGKGDVQHSSQSSIQDFETSASPKILLTLIDRPMGKEMQIPATMQARVASAALSPTAYIADAWDHPTMETMSENQ
jgi:hypothetical protein